MWTCRADFQLRDYEGFSQGPAGLFGVVQTAWESRVSCPTWVPVLRGHVANPSLSINSFKKKINPFDNLDHKCLCADLLMDVNYCKVSCLASTLISCVQCPIHTSAVVVLWKWTSCALLCPQPPLQLCYLC